MKIWVKKKSEDDFCIQTVLLDKNQRIRGIYNGLDMDASKPIR
jgi:hypothetical protein